LKDKSQDAFQDEAFAIFGQFGTILAATKLIEENVGFVRFTDPYAAQTAAFSMHKQMFLGRQMACYLTKPTQNALAKLPPQPKVSFTQL
jgi:RNA recognition motif-containing protein